jgi:hypothetical protein
MKEFNLNSKNRYNLKTWVEFLKNDYSLSEHFDKWRDFNEMQWINLLKVNPKYILFFIKYNCSDLTLKGVVYTFPRTKLYIK